MLRINAPLGGPTRTRNRTRNKMIIITVIIIVFKLFCYLLFITLNQRVQYNKHVHAIKRVNTIDDFGDNFQENDDLHFPFFSSS